MDEQTLVPTVARRLIHYFSQLPMNKVLCICLLALTAFVARAQDNIILKTGQEVAAKVLEVSKAEIKYKRADNPDGPVYTMTAGEVFLIKYANGTKDVLSQQAGPQQPGSRRADPQQPDPQLNRGQGGRGPRVGFERGPGMPDGAPGPGIDGLRYRGGMFRRYYTDAQGMRLGYPEVRGMMAGQPAAQQAFQRGRQLRTAALLTAIPAVALLGTGIALAADGHGGRDGGFGRNNDPNDPNGNGSTNRNERGDRAVVGAALAGGGLVLGVAAIILNHKATVNFRRAARYRAGSEGTSLQISPANQGLGVGMALRF